MGSTNKNKSKPRASASGNRKRKKNRSYIGLIMLFFLIALILITVLNNCSKKKVEVPEKKKPVEVPELNMEEVIRHAALQLGVPEKLIKKTKKGNDIHFTIPLDRDSVDLNFANMIFTGQVELAGGKVESGTVMSKGAGQTLTISEPNSSKKYIVNLVYDRSQSYTDKKYQLAIVVDDFGGFSGTLLDEWLETNPNVTFAILPDLKHSTTVMNKASDMGREVMLHLPMEPVDYPRNNPGEKAVLVQNTDREIAKITESLIRQLPKAKGINNHMGSLATSDERVMSAVLDVIKRNNLYFVDSKTTVHSVALNMAQKKMIPSIARDLFLDAPNPSEKTVMERVDQLKKLKERKNKVVVITHCFDRERINGMNKFIEEAEKIGFEIVPVSKLFESSLPEIL